MGEYDSLSGKVQYRPIQRWPGPMTPHDYRRRSPFSAGWTTTLDDLDRELYHLGATAIVLQVVMPLRWSYSCWAARASLSRISAIREQDFGIDGLPRAQARAEHPGVILSFNTPDRGRLEFATDTFRSWQENLRAIALGLEALRKVDRYGITRGDAQYAGFKKLEGREHCSRPEPHRPLVAA